MHQGLSSCCNSDHKKDKPSSKDAPKRSSNTGDKLIDRKLGAEKGSASKQGSKATRGPPVQAAPQTSKGNSYLADYDLPSSGSDSEGEFDRRQGVSEDDEPKLKEVGTLACG